VAHSVWVHHSVCLCYHCYPIGEGARADLAAALRAASALAAAEGAAEATLCVDDFGQSLDEVNAGSCAASLSRFLRRQAREIIQQIKSSNPMRDARAG